MSSTWANLQGWMKWNEMASRDPWCILRELSFSLLFVFIFKFKTIQECTTRNYFLPNLVTFEQCQEKEKKDVVERSFPAHLPKLDCFSPLVVLVSCVFCLLFVLFPFPAIELTMKSRTFHPQRQVCLWFRSGCPRLSSSCPWVHHFRDPPACRYRRPR